MHSSSDPTPAASELREGGPGRSLGLLASARVAGAWAQSQWASLFAIYRREDREAAEVRAAHLAVLLRLTPWLMAANALNVGLVIWVFRDAPPAGRAAIEAGQLARLRERGVRIALDDFGTGYSSLTYLRRFPFDTLKIDRSFVNEVLLRDDAKALVRMMTQLATTLGMRTVAEGVETAVQLGEVARAGCDDVQGYLVARPLPLEELLVLLRNWQAVAPTVQQLH